MNEKTLKKQNIEPNSEEICLYVEQITQQKNNTIIFTKDNIIKIVGKDKYEILKEKGIFSVNRKAQINKNKIEITILPHYYSISLEDFISIDISKNEAEIILQDLVKQNILEKKNGSINNVFELKIMWDEIEQIQLTSCTVYENAVKQFLAVRFTYKIALQKISRQLKENNFPIRMPLMTKPHQNLAFELLKDKVIKPAAVTTEDLETKLQSVYEKMMTKTDLIRMITQSKLIPKECTEKLFNDLVEKKWITQESYYYYYINDSNKKPIHLHSDYKNVERTVKKILDSRIQLLKKETIKNITTTLEQSRSTLKALAVPDANLKHLTEFCTPANIEEVHIFYLNGLDQLLQLNEKKWTTKMLINTAIVVAIGVCQIAIGTAIELYSIGLMTHVGNAFVNEGLNDIFFATSALKSGYFSWKDYKKHKMYSVLSTIATAGIGAYISRGTKVSRFGHKLAGSGFEAGGKKLAQTCGKELIKIASWKVIGKEVAKRITLKAIEGMALGLANAGIDIVIENCLQALCERIASNFMLDIEKQVEEHNIAASLVKAYHILGAKNAKEMINSLTKFVFTQQNCLEKYSSIAKSIASSVAQGIGDAVQKCSKTDNKLKLPINVINKVIVWLERSVHFANIVVITKCFLNALNQKILDALKNKSNKSVDPNQDSEKHYESFKNEIIDQWKLFLNEKAGQIVAQHITGPILKDGANHFVKYIGKKLQEKYQCWKENEYCEYFEQRKQKYHENLQNLNDNNIPEARNNIINTYHKDLIKLLKKTRNSKLFAAIVRENIPMDLTCVNACTRVIHRMLEVQDVNISKLTIIVTGEGGIKQEFTSKSNGNREITIPIELVGNHFQLSGNNTNDNNRSTGSQNNCLFEKISKAVPELQNINPETFRGEIANFIERDHEIQHHIRQGWHQFPLSLNVFGGKHAYDMKIRADELNKKIKTNKIKFSQSSIKDRTRDGKSIKELGDEMVKHGYQGDPIKAVEMDDVLVVLDHRRTIAAAGTESADLFVYIAVYGPEDEFSSETCEIQYKTRKAGEAVKIRMRRGSLPDYVGFGFSSHDVRIRTTPGDDYQGKKLMEQKCKQMNFQVGGKSRLPKFKNWRSTSLDRSFN